MVGAGSGFPQNPGCAQTMLEIESTKRIEKTITKVMRDFRVKPTILNLARLR